MATSQNPNNTPSQADLDLIRQYYLAQNAALNDINDLLNKCRSSQQIFNAQLKIAKDSLYGTADIAKNLLDSVERTVNALEKANKNTRLINSSFSSIDSIATKFKYDMIGYSSLSKKEIEQNIRKLKQQQELLTSKHFLKNLSSEELADVVDMVLENEKLLKYAEKRLAVEKEIEKKIGGFGKLVQSFSKIPVLGQFIDAKEVMDTTRTTLEATGSKSKAILAGLGEVTTQIGNGLKDPVSWIIFFVNQALKANAQAVELGKALGTAGEGFRETLSNIELANSNINVTTENLTKAFSELSKETGLAYNFSADQLTTQIKLTEQVGLQADEAAQINNYAISTGKTSEETYRSFVRGLTVARNQLQVGINFKAALAEAAKVSGELAANLGYNPENIAKAVVQMKALGTSLEQTKKQGDFLLDFESSISAELKAELLTGRALNLEKARAAALAGDQVTLAQELTNQGMTLQKFEGLNVLARRSYAEALGLSVDQLSDQLQKQKQAVESGKSLAQITEEEAAQALERQKAQDKFNKGIEKLTSLIGNLLAGPLGVFLDILTDIFGLISKVISGIQSILGSGITKTLLGALTGFAVGGPVGALIGGLGGAISGLMADDMVGYGARTLVTPSGNVALNNNDTVIAGTDLFKGDDVMSFGKGSLKLGGDNSDIIDAINNLANRPSYAVIPTRTVQDLGRQQQLFTTGMQNQSKLA
jgi:biotin operon repressor